MKLTDTYLRSLRPKATTYRIFEKGAVRGFGLQVTPKGTISFFICHTDKGKTRYKTLGSYPATSLVEARSLAQNFSIESANPVLAGTLKQLCDCYVQYLVDSGKKSATEIKRVLDRDVIGVLGNDILASEVTAEDVQKILYTCIERGAPVLSNRLRNYLMAAFQYAIKYEYDPRQIGGVPMFNLKSNPVQLIPRISSFEKTGERVLTLDELVSVINYKGSSISEVHLIVLKLIVLCGGLRPSEVTQAYVSELNFEEGIWSLPPSRCKNRKWHILPLTETTAHLFKLAKAYGGSDTVLFPCRVDLTRSEHSTSLSHAVIRMVRDLQMESWSPRDLRRTCKTWAGYAGLSKEIRDRLQNHALNDVSSKHYDRHLYLNEKRVAMLQWESFLTNKGCVFM